jgi:hypothetical protein
MSNVGGGSGDVRNCLGLGSRGRVITGMHWCDARIHGVSTPLAEQSNRMSSPDYF